jgi:hypothetical protein
MNEDSELPDKAPAIGYSIKIDAHLHKKLERHLKILKHLDQQSLSKQKWVMDAVQEKLSAEQNEKEIPKNFFLSLRINVSTNKKIESKVEYEKKFRDSYSKKQWLIEAINEKLEREEQKAKKLLEESRNLSY